MQRFSGLLPDGCTHAAHLAPGLRRPVGRQRLAWQRGLHAQQAGRDPRQQRVLRRVWWVFHTLRPRRVLAEPCHIALADPGRRRRGARGSVLRGARRRAAAWLGRRRLSGARAPRARVAVPAALAGGCRVQSRVCRKCGRLQGRRIQPQLRGSVANAAHAGRPAPAAPASACRATVGPALAPAQTYSNASASWPAGPAEQGALVRAAQTAGPRGDACIRHAWPAGAAARAAHRGSGGGARMRASSASRWRSSALCSGPSRGPRRSSAPMRPSSASTLATSSQPPPVMGSYPGAAPGPSGSPGSPRAGAAAAPPPPPSPPSRAGAWTGLQPGPGAAPAASSTSSRPAAGSAPASPPASRRQ